MNNNFILRRYKIDRNILGPLRARLGVLKVLLEIFEAVYVIEQAPYPVWEALILSFPKDHFMPIVKQVANSYSDNSQ